MEKYIRKLIFVFAFVFPLFVFGIDDVKAYNDRLCPSGTQPIEGQAISCDYNFFNGSAKGTLVFTNSSNHGYCANVVSQNFSNWGIGAFVDEKYNAFKETPIVGALAPFPSFELNSELKGKISFDVSEDVIKNAVNNKQCPRIKMVHGYDLRTNDTTNVVYSDQTGVSGCALSYVVSFGSECAINDGENMKELTADEIKETIEDQQSFGKCDENCQDAIKNWANQEGYLNVSNVGDPCSIISDTLGEFLKNVFFFISVAGIVLVVCLTALGFVKAIVASDDDGLMKAFKQLKTRIIVVVVLLLLPAILSFIIGIVNDNSEGEVKIGADGKAFCDVTKG